MRTGSPSPCRTAHGRADPKDMAGTPAPGGRGARKAGTRIRCVRLRCFIAKCALAFALLFHGGLGAADSPQTIEYQVKAAFLVKFAMFVEWPGQTFPDAQTPITLGILGEDPFGSEFEAALAKETANGRRFQLRRYKNAAELT